MMISLAWYSGGAFVGIAHLSARLVHVTEVKEQGADVGRVGWKDLFEE